MEAQRGRNLPKIIKTKAGVARGPPQRASPGVSALNHEREAAALHPGGPAQTPRRGVSPHGPDGQVAAHPARGSPAQVCLLTIRSWGQSSRTGTQNPKLLLVRAGHLWRPWEPSRAPPAPGTSAQRPGLLTGLRRPGLARPVPGAAGGETSCSPASAATRLPQTWRREGAAAAEGSPSFTLDKLHLGGGAWLLMGKEEQAGRCGLSPVARTMASSQPRHLNWPSATSEEKGSLSL